NDQWVDAQSPHLVLHVLTNSTESRDKIEPSPVHPIQRHQAIEIPQHQHLLSDAKPVEDIRGTAHYLCNMPILTHNHHLLPLIDGWMYNLMENVVGNALIVIIELLLFTII